MEVFFMNITSFIVSPIAALVFSPLLAGIIQRIKAMFAGRKGQPLLQVYYDLARLFRKGAVCSQTTSWLFRSAPAMIFASTLAATCFVPFILFSSKPLFSGDVVVLLYLLGLARFFLICSALDSGSAFTGMGASREAFFSALAEPVLFVCLLNIMRANNTSSIMTALSAPMVADSITVLLSALPLFIILLAENARIPFDDPNTHLELTMIHEVMILDNSGPDLGLLEYAATIKLWLFSLVLGRMLLPVPVSGSVPLLQTIVLLALIVLITAMVGVVESIMARLPLLKVPQLLFAAGVIALLGFFINATGALSW
jgi:formate hydrogenlyase subunit 4